MLILLLWTVLSFDSVAGASGFSRETVERLLLSEVLHSLKGSSKPFVLEQSLLGFIDRHYGAEYEALTSFVFKHLEDEDIAVALVRVSAKFLLLKSAENERAEREFLLLKGTFVEQAAEIQKLLANPSLAYTPGDRQRLLRKYNRSQNFVEIFNALEIEMNEGDRSQARKTEHDQACRIYLGLSAH